MKKGIQQIIIVVETCWCKNITADKPCKAEIDHENTEKNAKFEKEDQAAFFERGITIFIVDTHKPSPLSASCFQKD
jgi:hypothetical protein